MPTTYLPRGSLIQVYYNSAWVKLTEHNRREFAISNNRIEQVTRMSNGTARKFYVADKKSFTLNWEMLPGSTSYTVDGYWGAEDLINFYKSTEGKGTFDIKINFAKTGTNQESTTTEQYTVFCKSFDVTLVKRGVVPFYNVSMSMEQV